MDINQLKTTNPKKVIQVFHKYIEYQKDQKSFEKRKAYSMWRSEIISPIAYVNLDKLSIPKTLYSMELEFNNLIVLNDFNADSTAEAFVDQNKRWQKDLINFKVNKFASTHKKLFFLQTYNLTNKPINFEIFQLRLNTDIIELHLKYNHYEIGEPSRDNFKLCNLEQNVPVEIKINGKNDHSLSSGTARTFKEHHYIFHFIGEVNAIELRKESLKGMAKVIPTPKKVIDLMKDLY